MEININNETIKVGYTKSPNYHIIDLNDRPFNAIKDKIKKIEIRTNTPHDSFNYSDLLSGDIIEFINNSTGEHMKVKILDIRKYNSARELLEAEGTRNTLSSGGNLEQGIISINSLNEYKEYIPKNGLFAIEISLDV